MPKGRFGAFVLGRGAVVSGYPVRVNRYDRDVLAPGWRIAHRRPSVDTPVAAGLVVEEPTSGFVGAIVRWENGLVVLEDRRGKRRSFPMGPGFWIDGAPVALVHPPRRRAAPTHTASGSRVGTVGPAKVARASRIYVEGRHDAELVEKIWGDDLRHEGVVVEYLGGIDDLAAVVADFEPGPERRLGVLVDHLVAGAKETRIVAQVEGPHVLVTSHRFIDIWQAIRPERVGLAAWPDVPKGQNSGNPSVGSGDRTSSASSHLGQDWKAGVSAALGRPARTPADIAATWAWLLSQVRTWHDLDPALPREVERLIDFVTGA